MKHGTTYLLVCIFWLAPGMRAQAQLPQEPQAVDAYYEQILSRAQGDTGAIVGLIRNAIDVQDRYLDSSILLFYDAIQKSLAIHYYDGAIWGMIRLAEAYRQRDMYERSLSVFRKALTTARDNPAGSARIPIIYSGMCATYFQMGQLDMAAYMLYRGIGELYHTRSYPAAIYTYNNAGSFWMKLGQKDIALTYLEQAAFLARQKKDTVTLASVYSNLGGIYFYSHPDTAAYYFSLAAHLAKGRRTATHITALSNLSQLAIEKCQPELALHYVKEAETLSQQVHGRNFLDLHFVLGMAYLSMKAYKKAEEHLVFAAEKSAAVNKQDRVEHIPYMLSRVYAETGRYRQAYEQLHFVYMVQDSLFGKEKSTIIHQLEVKHRTAEKDKELAQKQLQIVQQQNRIKEKNLWIGGISLGVILLAGCSTALYRGYRHKQRAQARYIHILQQEQEITRLKAMMQGEEKERRRIARELHDGIGGLLSASKMNFNLLPSAVAQHPPNFHNGIRLLDEAYDQLRKTAHNLQPETLLKEGLARAAQHYCDLIGKGLPVRIICTVFGDIPRMDPEAELSLYRIIQELINNTVKHARASLITVQLDVHESQLHIAVEDDGTGIPAGNMEQATGLGLKNLSARVAMLGGTFEIDSKQDTGTAFYLEFSIYQLTKKVSV